MRASIVRWDHDPGIIDEEIDVPAQGGVSTAFTRRIAREESYIPFTLTDCRRKSKNRVARCDVALDRDQLPVPLQSRQHDARTELHLVHRRLHYSLVLPSPVHQLDGLKEPNFKLGFIKPV